MVQQEQGSSRSWTIRRDEKQRRLRSVSSWMKGPHLLRDKLVESLKMRIAPGDRIVPEGDNHRGGGKPADATIVGGRLARVWRFYPIDQGFPDSHRYFRGQP
jgi:hypothetical protein